jgi:spermidine/putrescine transport system substrate-binding protein
MKKIVLLIVFSLTLSVLASCEASNSIKLFMPTEYIDESLLDAFEEEYGIRVELIVFDSNEVAIPQIEDQSNAYDLVIPSDYAIEELAKKGLLDTIDWDRIDMAKDGLDPAILQLWPDCGCDPADFNILNYSVPYFFGNVGILYDSTRVTLSQLEALGWNALNDIEEDVMFYNSTRDMIMVALKALYGGNVDINNPTQVQLQAAEAWLTNPTRVSRVSYASDEIFDRMLVSGSTQYAMAVSYSGDAVYLMSENEDLGYYVPASGTNVWLDAFVIPKNAKNKDAAYDFINFMTSFDNMLLNTEYVGYTAPRTDVINDVIMNETYPESSYRLTVRTNDSIFRYNTDLKVKMAELWERVRAQN